MPTPLLPSHDLETLPFSFWLVYNMSSAFYTNHPFYKEGENPASTLNGVVLTHYSAMCALAVALRRLSRGPVCATI